MQRTPDRPPAPPSIAAEGAVVVWRMRPDDANDLAGFLAEHLDETDRGYDDVRALLDAAAEADPPQPTEAELLT